jgi:hypothetical protein
MAGIDATKRTEIAGRDLPGKDLDQNTRITSAGLRLPTISKR